MWRQYVPRQHKTEVETCNFLKKWPIPQTSDRCMAYSVGFTEICSHVFSVIFDTVNI